MVMHDYIAMLSAHTWLMPPVFARKAGTFRDRAPYEPAIREALVLGGRCLSSRALGCSQVAPAAGHRPADPIRVFS